MHKINQYVVGFLANNEATGLLLILKRRPDWQAGLLNGIGGLIEPGENPVQAMNRESIEETGYTPPTWTRFATLNAVHKDEQRIVHYFYAKDTETLRNVTQTTDEELIKVYVAQLPEKATVPNVQWLVPMALSLESDSASSFTITEDHPA